MLRNADTPQPARTAGLVAGLTVFVALVLTQRFWLSAYPDWQKAPPAALISVAVNLLVRWAVVRMKRRRP